MAKEEIRDAVYTRRYIYNFHYHLIWVTKYRNKTFVTEQLSNELKAISFINNAIRWLANNS